MRGWIAGFAIVCGAATTARADVFGAVPGVEEPSPPYHLTIDVAAGIGRTDVSSLSGNEASPVGSVQIGFRQDRTATFGLRLATLRHTSSFLPQFVPADQRVPFSLIPLELGAFAQAENGPVWGEAFLGASYDRLGEPGVAQWKLGLGAGVEGGVDCVRLGDVRLGIYGGVQTELNGWSYEALTGGVAMRYGVLPTLNH